MVISAKNWVKITLWLADIVTNALPNQQPANVQQEQSGHNPPGVKMPVHVKHFDRDKALEAILFIAQQLGRPSMHSISKMLYLADKLHLQEYGRMICGDRYIAMEYGPVPSAIYDMMKVADGRESIDVDWDELIQEAFNIRQGRYIDPKREPDMDLLSQSEIQCIKEIAAQYGKKSFGELTDITHDAAWEVTGENQPIPIEAIVGTLPNAAEVSAYLNAH